MKIFGIRLRFTKPKPSQEDLDRLADAINEDLIKAAETMERELMIDDAEPTKPEQFLQGLREAMVDINKAVCDLGDDTESPLARQTHAMYQCAQRSIAMMEAMGVR